MRTSLIICVSVSLSLGILASGPSAAQEADTALLPEVDVDTRAADYIGGSVTRALFTRAVVNREPVDNLRRVPDEVRYVYFFTELKGFTGEVVSHRWEHDGKVVEETRFEVGGPRWRIWSSRPLPQEAAGQWRVKVLDFEGHEITSSEFNYGG